MSGNKPKRVDMGYTSGVLIGVTVHDIPFQYTFYINLLFIYVRVGFGPSWVE